MEFLLLYELNFSRNPDFPYWSYARFQLDYMNDSECMAEFRFYRNDIYILANLLRIPEHVICYNGSKVSKIEALCIFLKRFSYPCRYGDMIPRFGRSPPELSLVSNFVLNWIHQQFGHKLRDFNQGWLTPVKLRAYADAIYAKGASIEFCWGFIDGTVRPICRPGRHQRILYNGHKRLHAIKFQSVVAPNGMIANLFGPMEGRRHDCALLNASGLLQNLIQHSHSPNGQTLCIYGDPAYPIRPQLLGPFKGAHVTADQHSFNKDMSKVRISVEWIFGDIVNYFAFLDFKKNLKIGLNAIGKMYLVCALLHNARTCLYKNTTSTYFNVEPPKIEEYFS